MKKLISTILTTMMIINSCAIMYTYNTYAETAPNNKVEVTVGSSAIKVNGTPVEVSAEAYIQESSNSIMVPLSCVFYSIKDDSTGDDSSKIMWDANAKVATIIYKTDSGEKTIQFTAGSSVMTVDGTPITMDNGVVAELKNDRMYVPFKAFGTALGIPISWDSTTKTAIYN